MSCELTTFKGGHEASCCFYPECKAPYICKASPTLDAADGISVDKRLFVWPTVHWGPVLSGLRRFCLAVDVTQGSWRQHGETMLFSPQRSQTRKGRRSICKIKRKMYRARFLTEPMCTRAKGSNTLAACCGKLQGCTSMLDMAGSYLGTAVGRQLWWKWLAERAVLEPVSF